MLIKYTCSFSKIFTNPNPSPLLKKKSGSVPAFIQISTPKQWGDHGGILLSPTCKTNYGNMQHNYVHMRPIYVSMQYYYMYVDVQYIHVKMRDTYTCDLNYVACEYNSVAC